jgi:ABC-type ATPase involved in cell division
MEKDEIFEMAERYVKWTGKSVFLTGKAGTGKTTFLKYITERKGNSAGDRAYWIARHIASTTSYDTCPQ